MNITYANVTEARSQITNLATQAKDSFIILLKNGKPVGGLINNQDIEDFRKWKEDRALKENFEAWAKTLPVMEISEEQAKSLAEAREEIKKSETKSMTVDELINQIS